MFIQKKGEDLRDFSKQNDEEKSNDIEDGIKVEAGDLIEDQRGI